MVKVSILMNAYNSELYLKETLDSVYRQTFDDWEIIFIDNCSTDLTKQIVEGYDEKIKYYKTENNIPLGAARNFGLQYCKGEYIAFLDTDDIWIDHKLEKQVILMDSMKNISLCYSAVIYIDKQSNTIGKMIPLASTGNVFAQQLRRYEINMQSVLLRNNRKFFMNETLYHSPDFNLFMNIVAQEDTAVIKQPLVKYRILENSLSSKNIHLWWSEMKHTLDEVFSKKPQLAQQYKSEKELAYAKVEYYKARYFFSINNCKEARKILAKIKRINRLYFALYILSFFPSFIWEKVHTLKKRLMA